MPRKKRLLIYDASQADPDEQFLSVFWWMWGMLGGFRWVVAVKRADDIPAAVKAKVPDGVLIDEWEFAGHGRAGAPMVDGVPVTVALLAAALFGRTHSGTTGWLRCCDAFRDEVGQAFAYALVRKLRHAVYGHTRIVNQARAGRTYGSGWWGRRRAEVDLGLAIAAGVLFQSGCYGLAPGKPPHWSPEDKGYSGAKQPNTALLTQRHPRESWVSP